MADLTGVNDTLPVRIGGVSTSSGLPDYYADVLSTGQLKVAISDASGNSLNSTSNALNVYLTNTTIAVTQSTSPWVVSGTVTANQGTANATPWNENVAQFGGNAVVTGTGVSGSGIPRVTVSNDSNILATQSGIWTVQPGNTANTTPWLVTVATALPAGTNNIGSINQGTSPWIVKDQADGPVTPGTVASFSMLMGGQYNSTLPTLTTAQQSALQLDSNGRLIVNVGSTAPPNNLTVNGTLTGTGQTVNLTLQGTASVNVDVSGTWVGTITVTEAFPSGGRTLGVFALNSSAIASSITANGNYRVVGFSTSSVLTVSFSAYTSGTASITIYGSTAPFIVMPYSANASNVLVTSYLDDGVGNPITSSSNGNAAPNQLLHVQTPDTSTTSTALGALNATVGITMAGLYSVGFQLAAGTFIGTLVPECSIDGGTTWSACSFYNNASSSVTTSLVFSSANTLSVLSILPIGGSSNVRVRVSAYTSGTANAVLRASMVTAAAGALTAAAFGTVNNTYVSLSVNTTTQLLAANTSRKYAYISNNSGGLITIQFGSATGLTSTARGLVIPNGSYYELKGDNLYTGAIFAYTTASGLIIAVTEGTP